MSFNWVDLASIGIVASVAGIQFLRSTKDFSRILYETIFLLGAVAGAALLLRPLRAMTDYSAPLLFGGVGVVLAVVGILLAALINRRMAFGLGVFGYFFGLLLAIACGYAIGHLALAPPAWLSSLVPPSSSKRFGALGCRGTCCTSRRSSRCAQSCGLPAGAACDPPPGLP